MTITTEIEVKVAQLIVDRENARHPAMSSEQEALEWMMANKGPQILKLAKSIAEVGLSPLERILVVPSNSSKTRYIVMEGNRRITALSFLNSPQSAPEKWAGKFKKIVADHGQSNLPSTLKVILCKDEQEALRLIDLRHKGEDGGAGLVKWGALEKSRADQRRNKATRYGGALALVDYAKSLNLLGEDTKKLEESKLITTVDRMVRDKNVAKFLGLSFTEGGMMLELEPSEVNRGVKKFLGDLVNKDINVRDLINAKSREEYLANFGKSAPNKHSTLQKPIEAAVFAGNPGAHQTKPKIAANPVGGTSIRYASNRKTLINTPLSIKHKRLNRLYQELKKLNLETFSMSAACALRAFIEGACDEFIRAKKITVTSSSKNGPFLKEKINHITKLLEDKGLLIKNHAQAVRVATSNQNSLASIESLHSFLHSHSAIPNRKDLVDIWDGTWEEFIKAVFSDLK